VPVHLVIRTKHLTPNWWEGQEGQQLLMTCLSDASAYMTLVQPHNLVEMHNILPQLSFPEQTTKRQVTRNQHKKELASPGLDPGTLGSLEPKLV
jgi:hypothetical protein